MAFFEAGFNRAASVESGVDLPRLRAETLIITFFLSTVPTLDLQLAETKTTYSLFRQFHLLPQYTGYVCTEWIYVWPERK